VCRQAGILQCTGSADLENSNHLLKATGLFSACEMHVIRHELGLDQTPPLDEPLSGLTRPFKETHTGKARCLVVVLSEVHVQ